eukprot:Nk52_evm1s737 gene=Nk52_evmTU1s737
MKAFEERDLSYLSYMQTKEDNMMNLRYHSRDSREKAMLDVFECGKKKCGSDLVEMGLLLGYEFANAVPYNYTEKFTMMKQNTRKTYVTVLRLWREFVHVFAFPEEGKYTVTHEKLLAFLHIQKRTGKSYQTLYSFKSILSSMWVIQGEAKLHGETQNPGEHTSVQNFLTKCNKGENSRKRKMKADRAVGTGAHVVSDEAYEQMMDVPLQCLGPVSDFRPRSQN